MKAKKRPWSVMLDATAYYRIDVHLPSGKAADPGTARSLAAAGLSQPDLDLGAGWDVYAFDARKDFGGGSAAKAADGGFDVSLVAKLVAARSVRVMATDEDGALAAAGRSPEALDPPWPRAEGDWTLESSLDFEIGEAEDLDDPDDGAAPTFR